MKWKSRHEVKTQTPCAGLTC